MLGRMQAVQLMNLNQAASVPDARLRVFGSDQNAIVSTNTRRH